MSKMPIYNERGIRLPESLTKSVAEADLCDTCARAKPTFTHTYTYTPHTLSKIKGKLWYFDKIGQNLTPMIVS